jgi:hypothetical protein
MKPSSSGSLFYPEDGSEFPRYVRKFQRHYTMSHIGRDFYVCVSMSVCVCLCIYMCVRVYVCVCICVYMYTRASVCVCVYMYICMGVCIYIYIYIKFHLLINSARDFKYSQTRL